MTFFLSRHSRMADDGTSRAADGAMATVEYRIAHGSGAVAIGAESAWEGGVELESSAARRKPLAFEVGSKMVLPVLDHAVRRLAVGEETGSAPHSRTSTLQRHSARGRFATALGARASELTFARLGLPAAVATTARDAFGADWCAANGLQLESNMCVAIRLVDLEWPYATIDEVPYASASLLPAERESHARVRRDAICPRASRRAST